MKKILNLRLLLALCVAVAPLAAKADRLVSGNVFTDIFNAGSTVNSLTPVKPTTNSTSYEVLTRQLWAPDPSVNFHDLQVGEGISTAAILEVQALFATNAVSLVQAGDYIQLTVVFTNTGLLTVGNSFLGFGLYNSAQVLPYPGGMNATLNNASNYVGTGYAKMWQGYWGQVSYTGGSSRISVRPAQTGAEDNRNQDLVTAGSGNTSYTSPTHTELPGSTQSSTISLVNGGVYTDVITIKYASASSVTVTNALYSGMDTNGTQLGYYGGLATNANFVGNGFDALAIGFYEKTSTTVSNILDIYSIQVNAQGTMLTGPPQITSQPVSAVVATNGACAFMVTADGVNPTYQWRRNGANLSNGGNISGATSPTLVVSSAGTADAVSGANGYYVVVSSLGGSTNSATNSLTLRRATNLVWNAVSGSTWDLNSTASWQDTNGVTTTFNYGDSVLFDDTTASHTLTLTGPFLAASSVTVDSGSTYNLSGTGSFAGPGSLLYRGAGQLTINNANTYTGGTIISNAGALLYLQNYNGLGSGPVTLAKAGGSIYIVPVGSASLGIRGDVVVADDFTITFEGTGSFSGCFFGNLAGTSGKTLTLTPVNDGTTNRFRVYGTNTVYNANLALNGTATTLANYYGSCLAPYHSSGSQTYNGIISGYGGIVQRDSGVTILNGQNTYAGGTWPTTGTIAFGADSVGAVTSGPIGTGPLFVVPEVPNQTGSGQVMAWGTAHTIANPIQYPSGTNNQTLMIGGTNALTFSGAITLNGNDVTGTLTNRCFNVTNTALTTFSGQISDAGLGFGLTKDGNGILALTTSETYTGPTIVTNGTLRVNGSLNAASVVTVLSNGVIAGTGTINGPVTVNTNGTLAPGTASIGTLNINSLTIKGNLLFKLNKSLSPAQSNDVANVTSTLVNSGSGTLTVTNLGSALVAGNKFKLFTAAVSGGATLNVVGGGAVWNNNLASDGSISVASIIKPVINTTTINGTNIICSGNGGAVGVTYYTLSTTNLTTPLANWTPIYTNTFTAGGNFSITNAMVPGVPNRFYYLKVP